MAYLSLYRKYRSQTFEDLIGQEHVVRTLQNAVRSGRIAQAFLFTGPRGTGKTSSARLLAKCLNCQSFPGPTPTPCNHCEMCVGITDGAAFDVLEMDAASEAGVEDVRERIVEAAGIAPMVARYKVFIIDEVHDLSAKAFDALLKTIEEPPPHLVFILATTEANRVPPTIRSRCQKFEFHRATMKNLVDRLTTVAEGEGIEAEGPALTAIARMADGGYRDALTLLEQAILVGDGRVTLQGVYDQLGLVSEEATDALLDAVRRAEIPALMEGLEEIARQGRDPRAIVESMLHRLADLTRASYDVGDAHDAPREASLHETAVRFGRAPLLGLRGEISGIHKALRDVSLPRLWLESELVRIATKLNSAPPASSPGTPPGTPPASAPVAPAGAARSPEPAPAGLRPAPRGPAEASAIPDPQPLETVDEEEPPAPRHGLDTPHGLFDALMRALPDGVVHRKKLEGGHAVSLEGGVLTVRLPLALNRDWFEGQAPRRKFLRDQLTALVGRPLDVAFTADAPNLSAAPSEAVELPLEGPRLADTLRNELGDLGDA